MGVIDAVACPRWRRYERNGIATGLLRRFGHTPKPHAQFGPDAGVGPPKPHVDPMWALRAGPLFPKGGLRPRSAGGANPARNRACGTNGLAAQLYCAGYQPHLGGRTVGPFGSKAGAF